MTTKKIIPKITRIDFNNLLLDGKNPRLPESINSTDQEKIWEHMRRCYDLDELAMSMNTNGYFEAEPLVAIPKDVEFQVGKEEEYEKYRINHENKYIIVEGNRRLATIKGLLEGKVLQENREPYSLSDDIKKQFSSLPVLVYPNRDEVLAFLGVHHLAGTRKWNVYERARYIVHLKRDKNKTIEEIQQIIGDRKNSAKKTYCCYRLIEIVKEFDNTFNIRDAKNNFSFLQLATGQEPIRDFIGLENWTKIDDLENFIPQEKKENLKFLFSCLFDNGDINSLIKESRQITSHLSRILSDEEATNLLKEEKDIEQAFVFIGGELIGLNNLVSKSITNLETVNGKLSGMDIKNTLENPEGKNLQEKITRVFNTVNDIKKKYE